MDHVLAVNQVNIQSGKQLLVIETTFIRATNIMFDHLLPYLVRCSERSAAENFTPEIHLPLCSAATKIK